VLTPRPSSGLRPSTIPIFLGVLINRAIVLRDHSQSPIAPALLALILVATFCVPSWGTWTGLSELVAIAIIYPAIIIAAMSATVTSEQGGLLPGSEQSLTLCMPSTRRCADARIVDNCDEAVSLIPLRRKSIRRFNRR